jgi:hypothetical protein
MKKSRIEKTIVKIFDDYEEGNLPEEYDEWIEKYMPKQNRKLVPDKCRCIANTHKRDRCAKKVYESNKYLCFQHYQIFEKNNVLPFGFNDHKRGAELMESVNS